MKFTNKKSFVSGRLNIGSVYIINWANKYCISSISFYLEIPAAVHPYKYIAINNVPLLFLGEIITSEDWYNNILVFVADNKFVYMHEDYFESTLLESPDLKFEKLV